MKDRSILMRSLVTVLISSFKQPGCMLKADISIHAKGYLFAHFLPPWKSWELLARLLLSERITAWRLMGIFYYHDMDCLEVFCKLQVVNKTSFQFIALILAWKFNLKRMIC